MSSLRHLRSSTASKRPEASGIADGQLAINTASGTPGLFFKDTASGIVKIGPAHVGATAPNASPAGSAGNSLGEMWVDTALATNGLKYWNGSAFVNLTPSGTTTTIGLVELATNAETQTGSDADRAVTPAGLQSKVSDSVSTTSSTTIASATAVKAAYDIGNAALPRSGGTISGVVTIAPSGSLVFEGATDDSFETTIGVVDPTQDHTILFPNVSGTLVTTGDSGSVTSTMIANGTIVDADINASAAITLSKLANGTLPSGVQVVSANITDGTIVDADINASAAIAYSKLATLSGGSLVVGNASNVATATAITGDVLFSNTGVSSIATGVIVDADINASAAIADTKLATISTAGKVSNSATTATSANTASAIVARDGSGNFTAGTGTFTNVAVSGGRYTQAASATTASVNLSLSNFFTITVNGNTNFVFSSPPASGTAYSFMIEVTHTSGTITWPAAVSWPSSIAPTLTTGKVHLFSFITDDGGTNYRGAALINY